MARELLVPGIIPLGSVSACGLQIAGDPNTGIYSPGADIFGIVTAGAERLRADASGRLLVNGMTAQAFRTSHIPLLQIGSATVTGGTGDGGIGVGVFHTTAAQGGRLSLGYSRNATIGSHTVVQNNDSLGTLSFVGSDGTDFTVAAIIAGEVDGTPGNDDMPGRLTFATTPDASFAATERMRINSVGNLLIGTTVATTKTPRLDVVGVPPQMVLADSVTNITEKLSTIAARHYTNAEEDVSLISGQMGSSNNFVSIGGSVNNLMNAATIILLKTATSITTLNGTERMRIDGSGNVVVNTAAIATNATDGFLYIPTCAGTPTGVPTAYTGRSAMVVDSTNDRLYFYDGGWLSPGITASSTDTLTNKTIALGSNTVSGTKAQFDTACTDGNFAFLDQANTFSSLQVLSSGLNAGPSGGLTIGVGDGLVKSMVTSATGVFAGAKFINNTVGPAINLGKSRGATVTDATIVVSGDSLGIINFAGADGVDLATVAASIECVVDGTPGANDMPGRLVFLTTADAAAVPTEHMRLNSAGRLLIGQTSDDATNKVQITGSLVVTSQLKSTVAGGTAPLVVTSTTKVANLNADLLDDMNASTTNAVSTIAARDGAGRMQATDPSAAQDVATKNYVDTGGAGGMVLLSSVSPTGTVANFSLDITNYKDFVFVFDGLVPTSDGRFFAMQMSSNGGTSMDAGASDYGFGNAIITHGETYAGHCDLANDCCVMSYTAGVSNVESEGGQSGWIRLYNPGNASQHTRYLGQIVQARTDTANGFNFGNVYGARLADSAIDYVRFSWSTNANLYSGGGNFSAGTIRMYGVKG